MKQNDFEIFEPELDGTPQSQSVHLFIEIHENYGNTLVWH